MRKTYCIQGNDCKEAFRLAFENRYTWAPDFNGYKGKCIWEDGSRLLQGTFSVDNDFKVNVIGIKDKIISKLISSQLLDVSIHRVRRTFDQTHKLNTFVFGDTNDVGTEVVVGGKNKGDSYRIQDKIITMVNRNIHGTLVEIYTKSVIYTDAGYLSKSYTSQYSDPMTGKAKGGKNHIVDNFIPLYECGPWVLSQREIRTDEFELNRPLLQTFSFSSLEKVV